MAKSSVFLIINFERVLNNSRYLKIMKKKKTFTKESLLYNRGLRDEQFTPTKQAVQVLTVNQVIQNCFLGKVTFFYLPKVVDRHGNTNYPFS